MAAVTKWQKTIYKLKISNILLQVGLKKMFFNLTHIAVNLIKQKIYITRFNSCNSFSNNCRDLLLALTLTLSTLTGLSFFSKSGYAYLKKMKATNV